MNKIKEYAPLFVVIGVMGALFIVAVSPRIDNLAAQQARTNETLSVIRETLAEIKAGQDGLRTAIAATNAAVAETNTADKRIVVRII